MSPVPNRPQKSSKSTSSVDAETTATPAPELETAATSTSDTLKLVRPIARPAAEAVEPEPATVAVVEASQAEPTQLDPSLLVQRPIPAPSEPMQYRAIGLVRGTYTPSEEQFTRGNMKTEDGTDVEAVLLGRVMSLVKNHLALEKEHLWVVYPRTREREGTLHLQVVGVWEPENLNQASKTEALKAEVGLEDVSPEDEPQITYQPSSEVEGNQFSIRGEIIYYSEEEKKTVVKIKQTVRKKQQPAESKAFKLNLEGVLSGHKTIGYFWDLQVAREDQALVIKSSNLIAIVPPFKGPKRKRFGPPGGGFRRGPGGGGGGFRRGPGGGGGRPSFRGEGGVRPPFRAEGGAQGAPSTAPKPIKKKDRSESDSAPSPDVTS